jgi:hypothetical protein
MLLKRRAVTAEAQALFVGLSLFYEQERETTEDIYECKNACAVLKFLCSFGT